MFDGSLLDQDNVRKSEYYVEDGLKNMYCCKLPGNNKACPNTLVPILRWCCTKQQLIHWKTWKELSADTPKLKKHLTLRIGKSDKIQGSQNETFSDYESFSGQTHLWGMDHNM